MLANRFASTPLSLLIAGLISGVAAVSMTAQPAEAAAKRTLVKYDCQNGPQMTVIYIQNNGKMALRYVYDGPRSAMRLMRPFKGNMKHFKDGKNSITLEPDTKTVDYREGENLYDRCKAVN